MRAKPLKSEHLRLIHATFQCSRLVDELQERTVLLSSELDVNKLPVTIIQNNPGNPNL